MRCSRRASWRPKLVTATGTRVIALVTTRDLAASLALLAAGVDDVLPEPLDELAVTLALRHVAALTEARSALGDGTGGAGRRRRGDAAAARDRSRRSRRIARRC